MTILLIIIGIVGWHAGMYGMFKKAGLNPLMALVPFYNTWLIVQKCEINKIWFWLQLIPIAGQFITIWITIIWVMHFRKYNLIAHTLTVFLPFIYLPYLGFSANETWGDRKAFFDYKKGSSREWIDAGVFAIVAATIIRTFVFEAYVIPTGSMEKTLLVNDFLFVSKMSYGARIPATPVSFPFVHNIMPFSQTTPSYIKAIQLPYKRLPGFTQVKRNDVVVFNFPAGDTIINLPGFGSYRPYYDVLREGFNGNREALMAEYPILVHPYDKTDNYIKRCVAVAGDVLQVKGSVLYINGHPAEVPPASQTEYVVTAKAPLTQEFFMNELGIDVTVNDEQVQVQKEIPNTYIINTITADAEKLAKNANIVSVKRYVDTMQGMTFPHDITNFNWSRDNFGPLKVPSKGDVLHLTAQNIALYERLITNYEGNTLQKEGNQFIINGTKTNDYTFKQNYYWMMGDNRHRSQDSRFWGFVPETHIVGKASLIWFSWQNGPRFKRLFNLIK